MSADLAVLAVDPSAIERSADPAEYVVLACERAKRWLASALDGVHIEDIVEAKSQAEAIRVYTVQKGLGQDAELAAQEIVRRAERCIGLAIRKGQEANEIAKDGRPKTVKDIEQLPSPQTAAGATSRSEVSQTYYAQSDDVTDEQYDAVIEDARSEGNLSRTNVTRKVKDKADPQPHKAKPRRTNRQPLPKQASDAGWKLRQAVERVQRILADDRLEQNKEQVAAQIGGHLSNAVEVCQDLLDQLN